MTSIHPPRLATTYFQSKLVAEVPQSAPQLFISTKNTELCEAISLSDLSAFYMAKLNLGGNKKTIQGFSSSIDVAFQYAGLDADASAINRIMVREFMLFLTIVPAFITASAATHPAK